MASAVWRQFLSQSLTSKTLPGARFKALYYQCTLCLNLVFNIHFMGVIKIYYHHICISEVYLLEHLLNGMSIFFFGFSRYAVIDIVPYHFCLKFWNSLTYEPKRAFIMNSRTYNFTSNTFLFISMYRQNTYPNFVSSWKGRISIVGIFLS